MTTEHKGPRLLDRVREALRVRHYTSRTEKAYVAWVSPSTFETRLGASFEPSKPQYQVADFATSRVELLTCSVDDVDLAE